MQEAGEQPSAGQAPGLIESLAGRPVLVFGAAGALGGGIAAAFAQAGAAVTGIDRAEPPEGRREFGIRYVAASAADEGAVSSLLDAGDPPWAVINTIGGFAPGKSLTELSEQELVGQLQLNLVTAALITKHALRVMREVGEGRIVHTASRAAHVTAGTGFAYSVSKAAVLHLVRMAADEVRGTGVTVNCVVPSIIDTPANRAAMPDADHAGWPKVPVIARTYVYLARPESGLINGAAVPV
ncbi:MAG TPA: SDR family oxidoreductase [Streptosporangiaceae bacterium]